VTGLPFQAFMWLDGRYQEVFVDIYDTMSKVDQERFRAMCAGLPHVPYTTEGSGLKLADVLNTMKEDGLLVAAAEGLKQVAPERPESLDSILATETVCIVDTWILNGHMFKRGDRVILTVANAKRFAALGRCRILPESEWSKPEQEPPRG